MIRRCATALAAVTAAIVYALSIAPVAYPGDPMPGCITQMGSVLCDGPIRYGSHTDQMAMLRAQVLHRMNTTKE